MPLINADMTVRDLFAQGVSVGSLRLTGAMSAEENVSGGARLAVKGIELPGLRVDSFDADLSGSQTAHELKIAADSRLFRLNAGFNGALNAAMDAWKGTLSHFEVKTDYGPVALRDQMPLSFDTKGLLLDVGQFCLIHPHALICLQNDLQLDLLNKKAFDLHVALQKQQGDPHRHREIPHDIIIEDAAVGDDGQVRGSQGHQQGDEGPGDLGRPGIALLQPHGQSHRDAHEGQQCPGVVLRHQGGPSQPPRKQFRQHCIPLPFRITHNDRASIPDYPACAKGAGQIFRKNRPEAGIFPHFSLDFSPTFL